MMNRIIQTVRTKVCNQQHLYLSSCCIQSSATSTTPSLYFNNIIQKTKHPNAGLLNFPSNRLSNLQFYSTSEKVAPGSKEHIEQLVKNNKIVVFMKGVPEAPQCGFSNAVVQILRMHGVDNYDSHNVLESDEIRQGVKEYSDWPTIPQVYFDGEFIGGCDILMQMHQGGDLVEELEKIGIKSTLPAKDDD